MSPFQGAIDLGRKSWGFTPGCHIVGFQPRNATESANYRRQENKMHPAPNIHHKSVDDGPPFRQLYPFRIETFCEFLIEPNS